MSLGHADDKLIFEFVGGPHDGRILQGIVGEASYAESCFLVSNWGAIGQRFKVASEYAVDTLVREKLKDERRHSFQRHFYIVTDRVDDDGEVWARAQYDPRFTTRPRKTRR